MHAVAVSAVASTELVILYRNEAILSLILLIINLLLVIIGQPFGSS